MALSGSLTTNKYNDDRYYKLTWTATQSIANNQSTIKWTLSAESGADYDNWYAERTLKVKIANSTVFSKTDRIERYDGKIKSGEIKLTHNTDGSKEFTASIEVAVYGSSINVTGSKDFTLDTIPRYATSVQSLKSKTETSITMNWSSDNTVDYIWYSTDNGSTWTGINVTDGKSGSYTISGLSANTTYKIKTRVRRKDSQLTTDSSALSVTTYNYPYCTSSPSFVLGDALTLKFYNPLSRAFKFYIIGNGTEIDVEYSCSTTKYTGVNSTTSSVPDLYATIPNAKSGKYKVKVVYGSSTKTRDNGNTYSIKESECKPTFTNNYTLKDVGSKSASITNSAFLIKGYSSLTIEIPKTAQMTTKNSATPKNYIASFNGASKTISYSSTGATSGSFGVVNTSGTKEISVTAYDSRGLSTIAKKSITIYDYYTPKAYIDIKRNNNFGEVATLKVTGNYTSLNAKNTITACKYRYRLKGGTWGDWVTLSTTLNSTKGTFTCSTITINGLDNNSAFEFEIQVTDKLGNTTTKTATLDAGQGIFFISSNLKKCYSNGEELATVDNVRQIKYYTQLSENTDLNTITTIGTYRSTEQALSDSMKNVPSGINGGFTMYVVPWTSSVTNTQFRRQEIIYMQKTYTRQTTNGGLTWSAWNTMACLEDLYPVGAVYCNSTNTNPSSKLGGTWELIDKGFESMSVNDNTMFTASANVTVSNCYCLRSGGTIRIRLGVVVNTSMTDTGMELGKLNFSKIGISGLGLSVIGATAYSDGANGGIVYNIEYNTGVISQTDVFDLTPLETGNTFYIDFTFTTYKSIMLDSFCDKFYWKRTA